MKAHFESKELDHVIKSSGFGTTIKTSEEAAVRYALLQCIDTFDEEEIEGYDKVKDKWDALWKKYSKTNPVSNRQHLRELHSFELGELSIRDAWVKLKELRRKVVAADPSQKTSLSESALFSLLLEGLPKEYETVVDALDSSRATVEDKLDSLSAKADRLQKNSNPTPTDTEKGLVAQRKRNGPRTQQPILQQDSDDSDDIPVCYRCDSLGHTSTRCPYKKQIRKLVLKLQAIENEDKEDKDKGKEYGRAKGKKKETAAIARVLDYSSDSSDSNATEYAHLAQLAAGDFSCLEIEEAIESVVDT